MSKQPPPHLLQAQKALALRALVNIVRRLGYHFFYFTVAGHHEVVVKSCLKDGHTGFLYFSINETLDTDGSCYESMLRIYVEPSVCFIIISSPEHKVLMVSFCDQSISVVRRQQFALKANFS